MRHRGLSGEVCKPMVNSDQSPCTPQHAAVHWRIGLTCGICKLILLALYSVLERLRVSPRYLNLGLDALVRVRHPGCERRRSMSPASCAHSGGIAWRASRRSANRARQGSGRNGEPQVQTKLGQTPLVWPLGRAVCAANVSKQTACKDQAQGQERTGRGGCFARRAILCGLQNGRDCR